MIGKKGLGKGLGALIVDSSLEVIDKNYVEEIDIDYITPNADQPRKNFEPEAIESLASSIKEHGVVQPIIVRRVAKGFEIVAGERRWRASQSVGLKTIPCIVKDYNEETTAKIALVENLQREDLNDIEEAQAYQVLIDRYEFTQEKISLAVGKSRSHIANTLRLLKLDQGIKDFVVSGKMTGGHARSLLRIDEKDVQFKLAEQIIKEGMSVREVETMVAKIIENKEKVSKATPATRKNADVYIIEEKLMELLSTKVSIKSSKDKGKIEIEFYNADDLNRILNMLL